MKIDFNAEKHEYTVDGVKVPSVSEILSPLSAERYKEIDRWTLDSAADRGKRIHKACELIDYGANPEADDDIAGYVLAYQNFLWEHEVDWLMCETILAYTRFDGEGPLYAGTVDRFGIVDGKPTVVDIKTYASLSTDAQLAASCQTALYRDAVDQQMSKYFATWDVERRAILHLKKDGTYRLVDLDKWDADHGFSSRDTAWMLWAVWNNKNKAKKTVRKGKK